MRTRYRLGAFEVSIALVVVLTVVGFVGLWAAWRGVAASIFVPFQLPYVVSGAMGGMAVAGFALGVLSIQSSRRADADRRADFERVVDAAIQLLETVQRKPKDVR